jgi:hypothetical protein
MVMTDQEIIDSIIKELENIHKVSNTHKVSFRDNDLLNTFIVGKDLISPYAYHLEVKILPELVQIDYQYFKQKLIDYLSKRQIYFIQKPEDFLDIFPDKSTYEDYIKVYALQDEIDRLDIIASDSKSPDQERIGALEKMYALYNQERDILEKYGE